MPLNKHLSSPYLACANSKGSVYVIYARFIIRDVRCVALHHIVVWNRESDPLTLCPPAYHTRLPSEASSLCSSVQNPIVVSLR